MASDTTEISGAATEIHIPKFIYTLVSGKALGVVQESDALHLEVYQQDLSTGCGISGG
jgi:hypothetical protein